MDPKEMEKRRGGWPWKKKNGFGEGGTSPPTVKLFDEQEVARILEDQIRSQQEHMDSTLRELDEKYSEKEKATIDKLDTANKKLSTALAEITVKDNLVKQHIKVAEEAVAGKGSHLGQNILAEHALWLLAEHRVWILAEHGVWILAEHRIWILAEHRVWILAFG
jgi:hypothetical protein